MTHPPPVFVLTSVPRSNFFSTRASFGALTLSQTSRTNRFKCCLVFKRKSDKKRNRLNDGKADEKERWGIGILKHVLKGVAIDINAGNLHSITNDNLDKPEISVKPVSISNELIWNKENPKFYYFLNTTLNTEYDYDNESGKTSKDKVVFDENNFLDMLTTGLADTIALYVDGHLWISLVWK